MQRILRALLLMLSATFLPAGCADDPARPTPPPTEPYPVVVPFNIGADEYLRDRFFRLDLPAAEVRGRQADERIEPGSLKVFRRKDVAGPLGPRDVQNAAAYVDSTGPGDWATLDFTAPHEVGEAWTEITDFYLVRTAGGDLRAVDLRRPRDPGEVLAVCYRVQDDQGNRTAVGDDPTLGPPTQALPGREALFYRLKLLKADTGNRQRHVDGYPLRNVYALGTSHIDAATFTLEIAANDPLLADPHLAAPSLPWIRLFGLDRRDRSGLPDPDGLADIQDPEIFDLEDGLLYFPDFLPHPFAADPAVYEALAAPDDYPYAGSYLAQNVMPEIYDPAVDPADYAQHRRFLLRGTRVEWVDPNAFLTGALTLDREAWMRAALPSPLAPGGVRTATGRVERIRWFAPRERVLARYQDPSLVGAAREATVPALDLYLRQDDGWVPGAWGGITTGLYPTGSDLTRNSALEIWINDRTPEPSLRSGRLHLDLGFISEDGYWPRYHDSLVLGWLEQEDGILPGETPDGVFTRDEDIGLDGGGRIGPERFDVSYEVDGDAPYPFINGTAGNNREDDEDLNRNGLFDRSDGYFTAVIDLAGTEAEVDVLADFEAVDDLVAENLAWRKYRIELADMMPVFDTVQPDWSRVTHVRIWYEDDERGSGRNATWLQFTGLRLE